MANVLFQNALKHKPQNVPPIWCMRQAGRYHKHYQKMKEKYSFVELCKTPELAAEVAMGPMDDFDFDVAILFSDLLFPLEALGMGLEYNPAPTLSFSLDGESIKKLNSVDSALEKLQFQKRAVELTRARLPRDKSLIGFVGGPWTLFVYAVEGSHKGSLHKSKGHMDWYLSYCEKMIPLLRENIHLQLEGGAEVVVMMDTAAGELSADVFNAVVVPQLQILADQFRGRLAYYTKGTVADHMTSLKQNQSWAGFGYDHRWDMANLLKNSKLGFVQGNLDQNLFLLEPAEFRPVCAQWVERMKRLTPQERSGWVCGVGHGLLPQTYQDNVRFFVQHVREEFAK